MLPGYATTPGAPTQRPLPRLVVTRNSTFHASHLARPNTDSTGTLCPNWPKIFGKGRGCVVAALECCSVWRGAGFSGSTMVEERVRGLLREVRGEGIPEKW
ncbi:uncharacterized protein LOC114874873 [Osmia bicornis bicornis]|uniref:uncharacterized protein LOC114874873 n=1 Tax=Osmia bicornis bicornis TaxID=1437191 RepID=UPI0010F7BAFD|nr:uncharacterized protein LOC114874873 [Osmia bicornis bicornis]